MGLIGWKPPVPDIFRRLLGKTDIASVRYRCLLPVAELAGRGLPVEMYRRANRDRYRAVVFSKTYGRRDRELARALRAAGRGVLFDLCDNHFYNPNDDPGLRARARDLLEMIGLADRVSCSTPALAEAVCAQARLATAPMVVADPVDPALRASAAGAPGGRPRLLWFGRHGAPNAPCGMEDLLRVAEPLRRLSLRRDFELVVASDDRWKFRRLVSRLPFPTSYVPWRRETFPEVLAGAWGVLIPVTPNPFTLCKTSNRLAVALYSGIPVLADSIPSYREFAEFSVLDDWEGGLETLFQDRPALLARAARGREYLSRRYLPCHVADDWQKLLAPWA